MSRGRATLWPLFRLQPIAAPAPAAGILAFYDGRESKREHDQPNWLDDGALMLGIASYAIVDGDEALVYDTHLSVDRARWIREQLDAARITVAPQPPAHRPRRRHRGLRGLRGAGGTADREAARRAARGHRGRDATGQAARAADGRRAGNAAVGTITVQALPFDIHAADHTLLWLPERRILLAADAVEDPITFVAEPDRMRGAPARARPAQALNPESSCPPTATPT